MPRHHGVPSSSSARPRQPSPTPARHVSPSCRLALVLLIAFFPSAAPALSLPDWNSPALSPRPKLQPRASAANDMPPTVAIVVVALGSVGLLVSFVVAWIYSRRSKARLRPGPPPENVLPMRSRTRLANRNGTAYLDQLSHAPTQYTTYHRSSTANGTATSLLLPAQSDNDDQREPVPAGRGRADTAASQATQTSNLLAEVTRAAEQEIFRNGSIRSIVTIPAYSLDPSANENVLGREGERDGIDLVIDPPETAEEAERRRDMEMESLFQIRQARRLEREARRRQRQRERDARTRGDQDALRALQAARSIALTETGSQSSSSLISAHQQLTQLLKPRISSVHYGNIGIARLDGSRVRSNSSSSDQAPLLDSRASAISAPSMVAFPNFVPRHSRAGSATTLTSIPGSELQNTLAASGLGLQGSNFPPSSFARHSAFVSAPVSRIHSRRQSDAGAGATSLNAPSVLPTPVPLHPPPPFQEVAINELPPPPAYEQGEPPVPGPEPAGAPEGQKEPRDSGLPEEREPLYLGGFSRENDERNESSDGAPGSFSSSPPPLVIPRILVTETTSPIGSAFRSDAVFGGNK